MQMNLSFGQSTTKMHKYQALIKLVGYFIFYSHTANILLIQK